VPTHDEDGDSISSSDRESLEEARQELIEAQEEYEEQLEEAYDSD
jgi:predicted RNase H-like HicB family nuclease